MSGGSEFSLIASGSWKTIPTDGMQGILSPQPKRLIRRTRLFDSSKVPAANRGRLPSREMGQVDRSRRQPRGTAGRCKRAARHRVGVVATGAQQLAEAEPKQAEEGPSSWPGLRWVHGGAARRTGRACVIRGNDGL